MPVYRIKEKFWFWDANFFIQDEKGNNLYSLHKRWFAPDQAVVLKDGEDESLLTIRKRIFSFSPIYQIVRNDNTVIAEIKSKRVGAWLQQKHVLQLADAEYVVDESKWNKKIFSIKEHKGGVEIAHVNKKMLDMTGSFWVDVKVDPEYYEGEALTEVCLTVLAACVIMLQLLCERDRQDVKKEKERVRQEKLKKMPLQEVHK